MILVWIVHSVAAMLARGYDLSLTNSCARDYQLETPIPPPALPYSASLPVIFSQIQNEYKITDKSNINKINIYSYYLQEINLRNIRNTTVNLLPESI